MLDHKGQELKIGDIILYSYDKSNFRNLEQYRRKIIAFEGKYISCVSFGNNAVSCSYLPPHVEKLPDPFNVGDIVAFSRYWPNPNYTPVVITHVILRENLPYIDRGGWNYKCRTPWHTYNEEYNQDYFHKLVKHSEIPNPFKNGTDFIELPHFGQNKSRYVIFDEGFWKICLGDGTDIAHTSTPLKVKYKAFDSAKEVPFDRLIKECRYQEKYTINGAYLAGKLQLVLTNYGVLSAEDAVKGWVFVDDGKPVGLEMQC